MAVGSFSRLSLSLPRQPPPCHCWDPSLSQSPWVSGAHSAEAGGQVGELGVALARAAGQHGGSLGLSSCHFWCVLCGYRFSGDSFVPFKSSLGARHRKIGLSCLCGHTEVSVNELQDRQQCVELGVRVEGCSTRPCVP